MSVLSFLRCYVALTTWLKKLLFLYTLTDPPLRWYLPVAVTRLRQQSGLHVLVDHLIEEDKSQRRASEEDCRKLYWSIELEGKRVIDSC